MNLKLFLKKIFKFDYTKPKLYLAIKSVHYLKNHI